MKNQYFGDINDYRKYGLLRCLAEATGLPVGVGWLLTPDDGRSDGEFRRYLLEPGRWRAHDPELYDRLRKLLGPGTRRSVAYARHWELLPRAMYFEEELTDSSVGRASYFLRAWQALGSCPLVFFDPDNGFEVPSVRPGNKGSAKYLYWSELDEAYHRGHSILLYQHFRRVRRAPFTEGLATTLAKRLNAPLVDSFSTAHVVFFMIARPEHVELFDRAHDLIAARWAGQINPVSRVAA